MLKKDTKGRLLTDTKGQILTIKDRWHPLVVAFQKRVLNDGGTIEIVALEEMNAMALNGDFDGALYVYVAGAYKDGKVYSLIGSDLTFERDSIAYRKNKRALWSPVATDIIGVNYDNNNNLYGSKIGEQFTVLNQHSENLSNSYWNKFDITVETTTIPSPIENVNFQKVTKSNNVPLARWRRNPHSFQNGITYTLSSFFQFGTPSVVRLIEESTPFFRADFNLENLTVFNVDGDWLDNAGIDIETNGIRCWVTFTAQADVSVPYACRFLPTASIGEYYYTTGINLSDSILKPYHKTTSSSQTQLADGIQDISVPMGVTEIIEVVDGAESVITSIPTDYEFNLGTTKSVIMR